ncbi:SDR family oxidoreductase [Candidatus Parcubacteria bacterium]|nr:SDR family oxidoreductase [Candidatus Parcubacteria bacterium]MCG2694415.1 SDR family oxidoreductase [Candidatus Parcubacteria bacterium]
MSNLDNIFNLNGKIAVITGGNGQLGTEYVKTLAEAGVKVAIFDVTKKINETLNGLADKYPVKFFDVDISNKENVVDALEKIEDDWGVPDILINNAALDSPPGANPIENKSFEDYSIESWESVLKVNLTGIFITCQVIGGAMAKSGRGSIINISSTYGVVSPNQNIYKYRAEQGTPFVKPASYSATKSAIMNFTRYLATYWAKQGVRVNTLVPSGVYNYQDDNFLKNYCDLVPMGRMAKASEYNGAILFLSSDASSYMTGATLIIDGGWTAW